MSVRHTKPGISLHFGFTGSAGGVEDSGMAGGDMGCSFILGLQQKS